MLPQIMLQVCERPRPILRATITHKTCCFIFQNSNAFLSHCRRRSLPGFGNIIYIADPTLFRLQILTLRKGYPHGPWLRPSHPSLLSSHQFRLPIDLPVVLLGLPLEPELVALLFAVLLHVLFSALEHFLPLGVCRLKQCIAWQSSTSLTLDIDRKWQNRSLRYFQQINEIKIIHIHCTHLLGGNDGLGALCPRGRLPLTPLEDRLGDGGQLLVRHLDVVFRRRRTDETKMVSFRVTLICSTCNSNGTECSNLEAFLDETRAYYDT